MASHAAPAPSTLLPSRDDIQDHYKWDLSHIFTDWEDWEGGYRELEAGIERMRALQGTLSQGAGPLLDAMRAQDGLGQLAYKVYYFAVLRYDEDQRDNTVNARKQQVQLLLARWAQATSWFNPELLRIPLERVREWMARSEELAVYRFAIENLFRQQEHVLDQDGEQLLSLSARLGGVPNDAYAALSTADAKFSTITLTSGERVQVSYGQYRKLLITCRDQRDRAAAYEALYDVYGASLNTYATLYNGVMQREWFDARARNHKTTLDAALFGNHIPPSVVENLIAETKAGVEPFRRYHRLRRRVLGVEQYHIYDALVPLVHVDVKYHYDEVLDWIVQATSPLGADYQARVKAAFEGRWIDVYENQGKRIGAYSAPVYGVHPYMLMNYNDTLDAVFTLAHEMGHSIHTLLAHEHQPFVYSDYTIFVAEVPSTLSEALLLEFMLKRATSREERALLLQHAIDGIVQTFYNQVLFADFELEAHRMVERDEPITADRLNDLYARLLQQYYGDAIGDDARAKITWARIPHFFQSPYYVYQYATCFASTAWLMREVGSPDPVERAAGVERYLGLLSSGGSDYPMALLARAGVDLGSPEPVRAVVDQLSSLVDRLEQEL